MTLNVGDVVETKHGERFRISDIKVTGDGVIGYFNEDELRLVEELKIGDYVEVTGQPHGFVYEHQTGQIDRIRNIRSSGSVMLEKEDRWYKPDALRKLTPAEIKPHTATQMPGNLSEIQELRRRIHDLEMSIQGFTNGPEPEHVPGISYVKDPVRDRLSAIEKRQGVQQNEMPIFSISKVGGRLIINYNGEGLETARQLLGAD